MLDRDLAEIYGVETKRLKEAVRRNIQRFPDDFMFQLTPNDSDSLRTQIASLKNGRGQHTKYMSYAFTEQGVAMLSSVLNSEIAIQANIHIIRAFTRIREMLLTHKDILVQLEKLEKKMISHDEEIALIFRYLKELIKPALPERRVIGFRRRSEE